MKSGCAAMLLQLLVMHSPLRKGENKWPCWCQEAARASSDFGGDAHCFSGSDSLFRHLEVVHNTAITWSAFFVFIFNGGTEQVTRGSNCGGDDITTITSWSGVGCG